ncbi:MAG: glycosyltransferase [Spirochaetes bacterium]|jgi:glycosyltransferase involved in cell wall biosynthesis|nr:glycosyltransferase [Spirochaetota bacterium]
MKKDLNTADYPFLPEPKPVTEQVWPNDTPPLLTIDCKTYMHEKFIEEAINGFLIQKTTFRVLILIHDDASTDRTPKIIKGYEAKYPQLIKTTCQVENQYKKNPKTAKYIKPPLIKSKYIAKCEGDDYWTDPTKLQKQVSFFESNPNYVVTYHDCVVVNEEGGVIHKSRLAASPYTYKIFKNPDKDKRDFTSRELMLGARVLLLTMCFRNAIKKYPDEMSRSLFGDRFQTMLLGEHGHGKYMGDIIEPAVYRRHGGGVSSEMISDDDSTQKQMRLKAMITFTEMFLYLARNHDYDIAVDFLYENIYKRLPALRPDDNPVNNAVKRIKKSYTYRVGSIVLFIPRQLKKIIYIISHCFKKKEE